MKKFLLILFFVLTSHSLFAATIPQNVSVKINFNYLKNSPNNVKKYQIENNLKLTTANHKWITVENENSKHAKSNIFLLSRITDTTSDNITLEFLVLDTANNPSIISEPKIIALYGKKNELVILDGDNILGITVLVKV